LINALVRHEVAETSPSIDACTRDVHQYKLEWSDVDERGQSSSFAANLIDTPGFESGDGLTAMMETHKPRALLFCASPGRWAVASQMKAQILHALDEQVYVYLVICNPVSGARDEFTALRDTFLDWSATYFGREHERFNFDTNNLRREIIRFEKGMVACVNAMVFNGYNDLVVPAYNVDELLAALMDHLSEPNE
jgi:hypothetical protein